MSPTSITPDQGARLRPPGLDAPMGTMLPPSAAPQIASQAATAALIGQQVSDIAMSMERAALYSGEIEKHFKSIREQTREMTDSSASAIRDIQSTTRRHEALQQQQQQQWRPWQAPGEPSSRMTVPGQIWEDPRGHQGQQNPGYRSPQGLRRLTTPAGVSEGGDDDHAARAQRFGDMNFNQGRDIGQNLSDLRTNVARRTNQWMSEWGDRQKPMTNAAGQYVDKETGAVTRASAQAGADWERGMSRVGRAQGIVNAMGEGKGLSGMLGEVGGKVAGPIGVAAGVAQIVNGQLVSQREQNSFYKNIYGGSESDAFGQRAQEWGFSNFGTLGTMSSKTADQLFKGVSSMGLQGADRQKALDFATGQYSKTGMDINTSLKLIQQATDNGVTSMNDFTYALDQVGRTAADSGKSLKVAQEAFSNIYASISGTFSNNTSTAAIAGGLTSMQQGLGHRLGSVNFGGMVSSQQQQMQMAAMLGMDPSKFMMQAQTNEGNVLGKGMDAAMGRIMQQGLNPGSADIAKNLVNQYKSAHGGKIDENGYGDIGRQIMSQNGNNPMRVQAMAQAMGLSLTPAQIPEFVARLASGDPSLNATKALSESGTGVGAGYGADQSTSIGTSKIAGSHDWLGLAARHQNVALAKELDIKGESGPLAGSGWAGKTGKSTDAYFDSIHETGKRYKSIEQLIRGGGIGDDTKIRVKDKSGKDVDVTLEQAIKYHKDELEAGNVKITAGKDVGKTVGEVTGVYSSAAAAAASASGSKTNVTVEAKGALKNFIDLQVSGGSSFDAARRSGLPASPFTPPVNLPSGTP